MSIEKIRVAIAADLEEAEHELRRVEEPDEREAKGYRDGLQHALKLVDKYRD